MPYLYTSGPINIDIKMSTTVASQKTNDHTLTKCSEIYVHSDLKTTIVAK